MIETAGLAAALTESGLAELHLTGPGTDIHLLRSPSGDFGRVTPDVPAEIIAAPGVGIFLTRHPLRAAPLADPGSRVRAGQIVALLRIGLLLRPVTAPAGGHFGAPLLGDCAMVGYGTPLFHRHPEQPETQA
jgi:acetyl-CoA carboxylase biotin carboxyl carrier protein